MSAKHRPKKEDSRKKNKNEGSSQKEQHEPNLGQVEAREEKEKASDLDHTSLSRNVDSWPGSHSPLANQSFQNPLNRSGARAV
jgi:hypothetical protein